MNDEKVIDKALEDANADGNCDDCTKVTIKAATIRTVKYLEGHCPDHPIPLEKEKDFTRMYGPTATPENYRYYYRHRKDCPDCMKQIHEELGI